MSVVRQQVERYSDEAPNGGDHETRGWISVTSPQDEQTLLLSLTSGNPHLLALQVAVDEAIMSVRLRSHTPSVASERRQQTSFGAQDDAPSLSLGIQFKPFREYTLPSSDNGSAPSAPSRRLDSVYVSINYTDSFIRCILVLGIIPMVFVMLNLV
ncbi:hypothetical protein PsorP6_000290 [Peronosclerospora sorghi]|uniref:Uncharacterized protein n=1 Tax=Peronosclerospora sorghi TaxID=230839 RepID=A0ACC0WV73_9STRA|nr:hypothetical protein PsorP6_000290 [Peronosclerospora sorghi]